MYLTIPKQAEQDVPLATWAKYRDHYLDEVMGLEGKGRFQSGCAGCGEPAAYRCKDCIHGALWCKGCLVYKHRANPLHVIEVRAIISRRLAIADWNPP